MQEKPSSGSSSAGDNVGMPSKLEELVDIPISHKTAHALVELFNYFDIHSPRFKIVFQIITIFRFFQLIGCSLLTTKKVIFQPGTLTYQTMSIISIFFHLIPIQYREGNEKIILIAIDVLLIVFGIYLLITAFNYKSTSKVSRISIIILSNFIAIGPFLILPIAAQYTGQMLSPIIANKQFKLTESLLAAVTLLVCLFYIWVMIKTFTTTIIFRASSFQTLEGSPQNKIFIITIVNTLLCALATDFGSYLTVGITACCLILYAFGISTLFNCGTFIKNIDQILVLGGCILGIIISVSNVYPSMKIEFIYKEWFFVGFVLAAIVSFALAYLIIHLRIKADLRLLDEIESSQDITIIKSKGKLKQLIITGFNYCHQICIDFSIFKMAINYWKDEVDVWAAYAKFVAIYTESSNTLSFIIKHVSTIKKNAHMVKLLEIYVTNIINTRETQLTRPLRVKINKITKQFIKAKNRLRNIWDLILQGSTNDMGPAIKNAYESVKECETDVLYLIMLYPNNRFALKQYSRFLYEIESNILAYEKTVNDIKKLQRGYRICADTVHDLGYEAFPNLPDAIQEIDDVTKTVGDGESGFLVDEEDIDYKQYETISRLINEHKIPAIKYMYMTTILSFIFLFLIPIIVICIVFYTFEDMLVEPLSYMKGIANIRDIVNAIPCFTVRALFEELEDPKSPGNNIIGPLTMVEGFPCTAFGGVYAARKIIEYYAKNVGDINNLVSGLRSYRVGNNHIEKVRDLLFKNILNYYRFQTKDDFITTKISSVDVSYFLASSVGRLLEFPRFNAEIAKGPESLTVRNNNVLITQALSQAMSLIVEFIGDEYDFYQILFWVLFGVLAGLSAIFFPVVYFLQTRKLAKNKEAIIAAIAELPKTVISNISQSFNKVKGSTEENSRTNNLQESEINRQEESIIKLFSTITDGVHTSSNNILLLCFLAIIGLSVGCFWLAVQCYFDAAEIEHTNCHHINYLYGGATFLFAMATRLYNLCLAKYDDLFMDTILDVDKEISEIEQYAELELVYFNSILIGSEGNKDVPFKGMTKYLIETESIIICSDPLEPPPELPQSTRCFSASQQLYIAVCYYKRFAAHMREGIFPLPWGFNVNNVFQIGPLELQEAFFSRAGRDLVPYMESEILNQGKKLVKYSLVFGALITVLVCIILMIIKQEDVLIKFTIHQLMRCQPHDILSNVHIMEMLYGKYKSKDDGSSSGKFAQFANEVINKLNDIFIICEEETGNIVQVNATFVKTFEISDEQILSTNIRNFFVPERFECETPLDRVYQKPTMMIYTNSNGEKAWIEFSTNSVNRNRIITGKDQTQNIIHEKLMKDEKRKSDKMLSSILPPTLVPRVQAGEKNISFSVQSVTVLFLDIVEFTPWCGSHEANYVMRMLNILFKEFDEINNQHRTMTKIKCIGDCYMTAGGIFDEVNQPAVHAKEVVDFGCMVINKLLDINSQENEKLRIRVGVNTGGPIVAGVIGTEKPTFEILGPAINIAHEMEHHGVPMKVHISRPVYELIYGQSFDIKERGEIDVKGGKMFTYLVEPK